MTGTQNIYFFLAKVTFMRPTKEILYKRILSGIFQSRASL